MDREALPAWLESPPKPGPEPHEVERMRAALRVSIDSEPAAAVLRPSGDKSSRYRLMALAGAGVAASTVFGLVIMPQGEAGLANAATPSLLGYQVADGRKADLTSYASRISQLPAPARYLDGDHRVVTDSWSLFSRIDGKQVDSAIIPEHRELVWDSDGSGTLNVTTGPPEFPSDEYRQAWEGDGRPGEGGNSILSRQFDPGEYDPSFPAILPTDAGSLLAALEVGHPIEDIGTAELFVAVADLYREQTPAPEVRALLIALIDKHADVVDLGAVTDRLGREGRAVAISSDYSGLDTRYVLTFGADDGALLSFEQVLTGDVGKLDVPSPAVISYELFHPTKGD